MSADTKDYDARPNVRENQQNPGEHKGESSRSLSSNPPRSDPLRRRNSTNFDTTEALPRCGSKNGHAEVERTSKASQMQRRRSASRPRQDAGNEIQRVDEAQSDSDLITAEDRAKGKKGIKRMPDDSSSASSVQIGRTTGLKTKTMQLEQSTKTSILRH